MRRESAAGAIPTAREGADSGPRIGLVTAERRNPRYWPSSVRGLVEQRDEVTLIEERIAPAELKGLDERGLGGPVDAVVGVEVGVMAVDAGPHAGERAFLLRRCPTPPGPWGIDDGRGVAGEGWVGFYAVRDHSLPAAAARSAARERREQRRAGR